MSDLRSASLWATIASDYGLDEPLGESAEVSIVRRRRRSYNDTERDPRAAVELVRDDGVLRWVYVPPRVATRSGRRSYRSLHVAPGDVVQRYAFHEAGVNRVTQALLALDRKLNAVQGMKVLNNAQWVPVPADAPNVDGRTLLLLHGTFSSADMFLAELKETVPGQTLLEQLPHRYGQVLAYDHGTLAVGAWCNALDLAKDLVRVQGPIDVVCHSRGGLVAAWLLRLVPCNVEKIVFVGSPLAGTSLASPHRLRAALDMIANFADLAAVVSTTASTLMPMAAGAAALAQIFGRTLKIGTSLPLVDAGVSLVPGLSSQQRADDNQELRRLFAGEWLCNPHVLAVGATFQPDEVMQPMWKFWRRFTQIGDQLKYAAADLVFEGPNDLVVDIDAMGQLGARTLQSPEYLHLSDTSTHHCNYFRNEELIDILDQHLR